MYDVIGIVHISVSELEVSTKARGYWWVRVWCSVQCPVFKGTLLFWGGYFQCTCFEVPP